MRLQGKVAVITGAADGMGKAAAEKFVQHGARVVLLDIQRDKGSTVASALGEAAAFVEGDVRDEKSFEQAVAVATEKFGGLDIMYHNAGMPGPFVPLDLLEVEVWDNVQALLLRSSMLAIKSAVPALRVRGGGSIILTSSISAYNLKHGMDDAYAVAKGAVLYLNRIAAFKYAKDSIRVNTISPGGVATAIHIKGRGYSQEMADAMAPHLGEKLMKRFQPLPRAGTPEDVAAAALFFASDESQWITGVDMPVDGGLALNRETNDSDYQAALAEAEALASAELGVTLVD